jgi:hypothetical protein
MDYSLSFDHDDGKHKARLFRDLLGLTRDHATLLLDALKEAAADGEAVAGRLDRYGQPCVLPIHAAFRRHKSLLWKPFGFFR